MNSLSSFLVAVCVGASLTQAAWGEPITRIAFGSCAESSKRQPIWESILNDDPEVFVLLGDNIYGDTTEVEVLREKYREFGDVGGFKRLRNEAEVVATWDDHDYGMNDAGREYPLKRESREAFLTFFREEESSPRWTQEGGIYTSYLWGEPGRSVQLILLDLRWDRTPLAAVDAETYRKKCRPAKMGPYLPQEDDSARIMGEAQWRWLEAQLEKPADIRIIGSSIQVLSDFTGWEAWANFPKERQRLFALIEKARAHGTFLISGDTHWAEFSRLDLKTGYPLWELTSSGLTEEWSDVSPNKNRIGRPYSKANYGLIEISWNAPQPQVTLSVKNVNGRIEMQNTIVLSDLKF
ncbi:alkaline phosphatase D family protein [Pelagicoccus sp. SDUM812003]|uniref:alkaline phosphatase D family protein n=1 Tax=Pelagicoccus sp. SDUM812003 TaxID=3041267 RepID=UPI00280E9EE3|nr:alkaline phosphatase D family protein [Pelagicoccus sp. SDUM812003]MDQ8202282.1 alkaline phosphatase D family protein [Pelagicoccus sp. SDUM812003]